MRGLWLVVLTCSACRFGAYAGSTRGLGTASPTSAGAVSRDASLALDTYEMTSDYVFRGRFVAMTSLGGGFYVARSREMTTLYESDSLFDIHASVGAGYQAYRTDYVAVVPYVAAATNMFSLGEDYTEIPTRYTAGVEVNALFMRPEKDLRGGLAARIGYSASSGRLVDEDGMGGYIRHDVSFDGITMQVGLILNLDIHR